MHKIVRGLIVGTIAGVAVGTIILMRRGREQSMMAQPTQMKRGTRHAMRMVQDGAKRWGSMMKNGTEAFSHRLVRQ